MCVEDRTLFCKSGHKYKIAKLSGIAKFSYLKVLKHCSSYVCLVGKSLYQKRHFAATPLSTTKTTSMDIRSGIILTVSWSRNGSHQIDPVAHHTMSKCTQADYWHPLPGQKPQQSMTQPLHSHKLFSKISNPQSSTKMLLAMRSDLYIGISKNDQLVLQKKINVQATQLGQS